MTARTPRSRWTEPGELLTVLRRDFASGDLLRAALDGTGPPRPRVRLRAPTARELADDFGAAKDWADRWRSQRSLQLEEQVVGGRLVGANRLPVAVVLESVAEVAELLGVADDLSRFVRLHESVPPEWARVRSVVRDRPHLALEHADRFEDLLAVVAWIERHGGPDVLLRQVDVPEVDTKFVESRAGILAALLDAHLPAERVDERFRRSDLARRYGLRGRPVRFLVRSAHPQDGPWRDAGVPLPLLAEHPPFAHRLLVVENEATFDALEPPPQGAILCGGGYRAELLARLPWLSERDVVYWGDLDTHGFTILDRLRARAPGVRSVLMDEGTLLAHRAHWGREDSPQRAPLTRLTPAELAVHEGLVQGRWQEDEAGSVRLEQERIRFGWARAALDGIW